MTEPICDIQIYTLPDIESDLIRLYLDGYFSTWDMINKYKVSPVKLMLFYNQARRTEYYKLR